MLGMFALLLTQCIHTTSEPSMQELAATVATQSSQISALVATVAQQAARISELEARMSTPGGSALAEVREGRRLSASPASQRTIWHGGTLHAIDDPASCGLDSELHSTTAPLTIRRTDDILSFGYSDISPVFNISSPIRVVHSVGCNSTMNHMDTLSVSGSLYAGVGHVDVMARMLAFARPLKLSYPTMSGDGNKVGLGSDARNVIVLQATLAGTGLGGGTPQEDGIVIEATSASGATAASATEKTWFAVNAVGASGVGYGYLKMIEFKVTCTSGTHLYLKPISAKNKANYVGASTETYKYFDAGAINAMWGGGTMTAATLADTKAGDLYAIASVTFIII